MKIENRFKIICGKYEGFDKKAVDMISATVNNLINYTLPVLFADKVSEEDLTQDNLIIVGSLKDNKLLKDLADKNIYTPTYEEQGYSMKVTASPYNDKKQVVIIQAEDGRGLLYGAVDLEADYVSHKMVGYSHDHFIYPLFQDLAPLWEFEKISAPTTKRRGLWTWGHVIYNYQKYFDNMLRLKMNTIIFWNDFVPVNIKEILAYAKECGIDVYVGFSWGWIPQSMQVNGGIDISDEKVLEELSNHIVKDYVDNYKDLDVKGIYFQSFTETKADLANGKVIAECVVNLVNKTAKKIFDITPNLEIQFGLHATSVFERLNFIEKTDKRVAIVWEDCGAFPYEYMPYRVDDFDKAYDFTKKISTLRGKDEAFGLVTKGLICLNWGTFEHQKAPFVMGRHSDKFIENRTTDKAPIFRYLNAYWLKNAKYVLAIVRLVNKENKDAVITGLVEDGMFENKIWWAVAVYSEILWDSSRDVNDILVDVSLRQDIVF